MRPSKCLLLAAVCLTGTTHLHAAESPFIGKWKINVAKSTITGFTEKIEDLGHGEYKFIFGDDAETYFVDGQEHPTRYGSQRTVTSDGPDHWTAVTKRDSKVTGTDTWALSEGGNLITVSTEAHRPDGTTVNTTFTAKRKAGASGLAGTWESTTVDPAAYPEMTIEPAEGDGLVFVFPAFQERDPVKFDGKDHPAEGPRVAPGSTLSGQRIDERTIELTDKLKDKVMDTQHVDVSGDGKTLTQTLSFPGVEKKEIHVYERQ